MFVLLLLFKHIVPGVILLSIQQVLMLQIHPLFSFPDILFIYILLLLYFNEEQSEWVFISAFILSLIQEYQSGQIIGITSLFFLFYAFYYSRISNLFSRNTFLIPLTVLSYVLWFTFELLLHYVLNIEYPSRFFSFNTLIKFVIDIGIIVLCYFFLSFLFSKRVSEDE